MGAQYAQWGVRCKGSLTFSSRILFQSVHSNSNNSIRQNPLFSHPIHKYSIRSTPSQQPLHHSSQNIPISTLPIPQTNPLIPRPPLRPPSLSVPEPLPSRISLFSELRDPLEGGGVVGLRSVCMRCGGGGVEGGLGWVGCEEGGEGRGESG